MKPSLCPTSEVMIPRVRMCKEIIKFIKKPKSPVADIGELNYKSIYLSEYYEIKIDQIIDDLDYYFYPDKIYKTIFCFEVLSHIVNPLVMLSCLSNCLDRDGVIYLSMPNRPRFMWNKNHFREFGKEHFQKFILDELDMEIVRMTKFRLSRGPFNIRNYLGVRPMLRYLARIIWNYTYLYEIRFKK
jgi:hypothetical protein